MTDVERLARLRRRLDVTGNDDLLTDLLGDAEQMVRAYTGLAGDLPVTAETAQIMLAASEYLRLGAEGQQSHSEGGVSVGFADAMTDEVKTLLLPYRKAHA